MHVDHRAVDGVASRLVLTVDRASIHTPLGAAMPPAW
jgi:hypothetical protein